MCMKILYKVFTVKTAHMLVVLGHEGLNMVSVVGGGMGEAEE